MSTGFWLITSGAYVGQELAVEFGQMPPCFLPVGTRRLYEYQLERIGQGHTVYITLPESFEIPPEDQHRLAELKASVLAVPDSLSLGESILYALNLISSPDQPVWVLHGDTLIDEMPSFDVDKIGTAKSTEGYSWAEVELDGERVVGMRTVAAGDPNATYRPVACGYFSFAHMTDLVRGITRARGSFIDGILDYAKIHHLSPVSIDHWYDFGHVQTFFRSRRLVTSARHFNSLKIDGRTARKSSDDTEKMRAEAAWLQNVPPALQIYAARLIDSGKESDNRQFYETEYGYLPTLSELFVFGTLGAPSWFQILRSCQEFLNLSASVCTDDPSDPLLQELAVTKTSSRLLQFNQETGFNVHNMLRYDGKPLPSLMQIAEDVASQINFVSGRRASVMHGDFCFSNILYDSRVQRIRVIDPRGYIFKDKPSTMGDIRYDLAKFTHSIIGRYDQIISGRYHLEASEENRFLIEFEQAPHQLWLEHELKNFKVDGISANNQEIRALCVCLFLSMLPLHADRPDRQIAFVANALRLYSNIEAHSI